MKIAMMEKDDGEGMPLLIVEDVNLLRRIFLVGKISKILTVGWYSSPSPGFLIKVLADNFRK